MMILEVIKSYHDKRLNVNKQKGELFRADPERAQELVSAGVAQIIFEDPASLKGEAGPQDDNS